MSSLCLQPELATLLAKPDKGMHDSIFASANGQTRRLQSFLPDPDVSGKVRTVSTPCIACTTQPMHVSVSPELSAAHCSHAVHSSCRI